MKQFIYLIDLNITSIELIIIINKEGKKMGKKKSKMIIKEAETLGFKNFPKYTFFGQRKGGALFKTDTKGHIFKHNVPRFIIRMVDWLESIDSSTQGSESGGARNITFYILSPQVGIYLEVNDSIAGALDIPGNHVYKMDIYTQSEVLVKQIVKDINDQWEEGILAHLDLKKIEKKFKVSPDDVTNAWNKFLT
jgi:hypothetical protein